MGNLAYLVYELLNGSSLTHGQCDLKNCVWMQAKLVAPIAIKNA